MKVVMYGGERMWEKQHIAIELKSVKIGNANNYAMLVRFVNSNIIDSWSSLNNEWLILSKK
jgi:hypothetical protein